jgi:hypothetical protein
VVSGIVPVSVANAYCVDALSLETVLPVVVVAESEWVVASVPALLHEANKNKENKPRLTLDNTVDLFIVNGFDD